MNLPKTEKKRIVIIGGGFAGISLAKKLKDLDAQIVMIDKHNYHTFQPLLYQVSTGGLEPDSIAYPIRKILKRLKNFHFRWAVVDRIDPEAKKVITSIGDLSYDYLVLATGTRTNFFGNTEIQSNAMPMKNVPQSLNIRSYMLQNFEKADDCDDPEERMALLNFCIVGAGPTGVELAGAFAELKKNVFPKDYRHLNIEEMQIHLFEGSDRVLPPMSALASKKARRFLEEFGVHLHLNTLVASYDGECLRTNTGESMRTKNFIWTAGVTGAAIDGFSTEALQAKLNRFKVDRMNRVEGYPGVFAIGDVAFMPTDPYPEGHPQMAQPAIQQGEHLARNLKRLFKGQDMEPFSYYNKGNMATIGRNRAVVDLPRFSFGGFLAWFVWMFVHLMSLVGFRNRVIVFFNWVYNYINYDKAARLIVRPFRPKN
ncbi:NAD(P)/FAD-dependent oxidoreductase [Poritiphilus flavus]|uniref:NADH:ubiquinone reductase (non-electrogenic) n=1 Tax=Poritiphilus flavus TaxID=2697053 RepID=A0A6L9E763_9FLAO|nr:NAD(P)/FAD-dependent oxidoreductase [Poritiphilus flavus]NAS10468.1 FAD-dependent oxidoreductase [Poritiphilus flavus]